MENPAHAASLWAHVLSSEVESAITQRLSLHEIFGIQQEVQGYEWWMHWREASEHNHTNHNGEEEQQAMLQECAIIVQQNQSEQL